MINKAEKRQGSILGCVIFFIINASGRKEPNEKYENIRKLNWKGIIQTRKKRIGCKFEMFVYFFGRADAVLSSVKLGTERPAAMTLLVFS